MSTLTTFRGNWSGPGVVASTKKFLIAPKPGSGVEIEKRKDAKLKTVIINEKRQKKVYVTQKGAILTF
jgi:U3 small nucleolar RNA-associated protein 14